MSDFNVPGSRPTKNTMTFRKSTVKPLGASRSLSETFPGTGYKTFSLEGTTLRGNREKRSYDFWNITPSGEALPLGFWRRKTTRMKPWKETPDGQLTLAVWLPIALSMSLRWSRASSLQFSGLGQAGIVHFGLGQRVLTVMCEIREQKTPETLAPPPDQIDQRDRICCLQSVKRPTRLYIFRH